MTTVRQAWARLIAFFRKEKLDQEFDEELAAHVDLATQDYLRQGMSAAEAHRFALIRLGGFEQSKELHRDSRGLPLLDGITKDLRFAIRGLRRSPAFTAVAVGTLALGIGVNTAVFTVAKAALFSGFPMIKNNDRLLYLSNSRSCCVSYPDFEDWRAQAQSFEGMAIVHGTSRILSDTGGFAETYGVTEVSADTFKLVGQQPILGRDFTAADEVPGAPAVVILSYEFWVRRFAQDPAIIGKTVRMNGEPATVIGVMPQGFSFPQKQDMWVPLVKTAEVMQRDNRGQWFAFGRLKKGATSEGARAEMETIGRRLGAAYPETNQGRNLLPVVQTFRDFFIFQNETPVYWIMWGAVGFVLLIACANLANLMLARAVGRSGEMSVRIALGAGRWRIIRLVLLESAVLSALGGLLGWLFANWAVRAYALADRGPGRGSWRILDYSMDDRVLWYLAAISAATALLFGLVPALRLSRLDINSRLKDGSRGTTGGHRGKRLSSLLVTGETALALALLAGAGLMIRSFWNLYTERLGVKTSNLLTITFDLPEGKYPDARTRLAFYDRMQQNSQAIPGVGSVAISRSLPALGGARLTFELPGTPELDNQHRPTVEGIIVGPEYFKTVGLAVLSGRDFNDRDRASSPPVAIVSERFAQDLWPEQEALGKRLRVFQGKSPGPWLTVVGVISNIAVDYNRPEIKEAVYLPYGQQPDSDPIAWGESNVIARTLVPPDSLTAAFRSEMHKLDSALPIFGPITLDQRFEQYYWTSGLDSALFFIFACVALLLASVGLYAVVAHSVSQRTQEIGVRMAMGATARDIFSLIFSEGLLPSGVGMAIGVAGSLGLSRVLKSQLVHISSADPVVLVAASAVLVASAALGCWIPARRAMRVDPVVALRNE